MRVPCGGCDMTPIDVHPSGLGKCRVCGGWAYIVTDGTLSFHRIGAGRGVA